MTGQRRLARILHAIANVLEKEEPSSATAQTVCVVAPSPPAEPDAETEHARRFSDDLTLRDALYRALRRYSPSEKPAQA